MQINENKLNFIIVGTDTHVGKTVVSLLLMKYLCRLGYQPEYLKPLQTGCQTPRDSDSDAQFIYQHFQHLRKCNPDDSVIYCFQPPKAPWFAARNTNMNIDAMHLLQQIQLRLQRKNPVVLEAAGGLMVPITDKMLYIDFLSQINSAPILVARAGLGTINHSLLSISALAQRKIVPAGVILSNPLSVPQKMVHENTEAIERFSGIRVLGILDKIDDFHDVSDKCLDIFRHIFQPQDATNKQARNA
jgi:dethiobiotin synthetase